MIYLYLREKRNQELQARKAVLDEFRTRINQGGVAYKTNVESYNTYLIEHSATLLKFGIDTTPLGFAAVIRDVETGRLRDVNGNPVDEQGRRLAVIPISNLNI